MYPILITVGFAVVIFIGLLLFTRKRLSSNDQIAGTISSATLESSVSAAPFQQTNASTSLADARPVHLEQGYNETYQVSRNTPAQRPLSSSGTRSGSAHTPPSLHSQHQSPQRFSSRTGQTSSASSTLDKKQSYEQGMQAIYDEQLEATYLVITRCVMETSADVDLAFQICTRKIQAVLRPRGLQRAPLLVDIAGLVIGGEATTAWGQSLKSCWDQICAVAGHDLYMAAHYNSKASQPDQEQLREKVRRIQIMTSAALNDFQSNIFETREEAVAFLFRMKELQHS